MREPRGQSHPSDDGAIGNIDKSEKQPPGRKPLITQNWGPVVGAVITAAASLLIYSFNQIRHIDERLDLLEREASALLDGAGTIKPSREALENKYHLEALQRRVDRLEDK